MKLVGLSLTVLFVAIGWVLTRDPYTRIYGSSQPSKLSGINIQGLDRLELLERLWNASYIASFHYNACVEPPEWNTDTADSVLRERKFIDYFLGRAIKMDLSYDMVYPEEYEYQRSYRKVSDIVREQRERRIVPAEKQAPFLCKSVR